MSISKKRKRLLLEYGTIVLKKLRGSDLSSAEIDRMSRVREELKTDHETIMKELEAVTSRNVSV